MSRHGHPALDRINLLLDGKHYDRLLPTAMAGRSVPVVSNNSASSDAAALPTCTVEDSDAEALTHALERLGFTTEAASESS